MQGSKNGFNSQEAEDLMQLSHPMAEKGWLQPDWQEIRCTWLVHATCWHMP